MLEEHTARSGWKAKHQIGPDPSHSFHRRYQGPLQWLAPLNCFRSQITIGGIHYPAALTLAATVICVLTQKHRFTGFLSP